MAGPKPHTGSSDGDTVTELLSEVGDLVGARAFLGGKEGRRTGFATALYLFEAPRVVYSARGGVIPTVALRLLL